MAIFVDENIPYLAEALSDCGETITFRGRDLTGEDLRLKNCEYLFVRSTTKVNGKLLDDTPVRFVGSATSGIDHVDADFLSGRGVFFTSAPGSNANSVAEYVFYGILKWAVERKQSIEGKTIGIVGYGNIGKIVAEYAAYFGMKIIVNDPPLLKENFSFPENLYYAELNKLCRASDIITNHVPLTRENEFPTFRLFNSSNIPLMKKGCLFIHASRGYVADEKEILKRMENKSLEAVIDVWENEPLIEKEAPRLTVVSTPHIAGYSRDGKLRGVMKMAEEFSKYTGLKVQTAKIEKEMASYKKLSPEYFNNHEFIYESLKRNRKLDEDSAAFRETMFLPDTERAPAFDLLRKNYPVRREFL